ncbi:MAG: hypothetical protein B7Y72_06175 [Mehylophilales bacterium 35-46-6]|nr:MAG: hypothetical protein B7Y72_06175 [Mehylophilales bacterium 35-46-6]
MIYLRAKVNDLYQRTRNDKSRPLLQGANPKQKLEQLYVARDPIYSALADYIVDTGAQSANEITSRIEQLLLEQAES